MSNYGLNVRSFVLIGRCLSLRTPEACIRSFPKGALPATIIAAGPDAARAFLEFFTANIRNKNTRMAYARACGRFLDWCDELRIPLVDIEPIILAGYVEQLTKELSPATVKQHLAGIRMMFDWLTSRQILAANPATSVRGPKHSVMDGATPAFDVKQARKLLESIDVGTALGLRDRAMIATLIYTGARIGAVCNLKVKHFMPDGGSWCLQFGEKGGKQRKIPCRHNLEGSVGILPANQLSSRPRASHSTRKLPYSGHFHATSARMTAECRVSKHTRC
ncbi:MAG: tyrosine-type recombinase/integrase [Phycisphaerae bacterium]